MGVDYNPRGAHHSSRDTNVADGVSKSSHSTSTDERTPLLATDGDEDCGSIRSFRLGRPGHAWSPRAITAFMLLIIGLLTIADALADSPLKRVFESIYCYEYWEEHDPSKLLVGRDAVGPGAIGTVAEKWCKIPTVQAEVATLRGWQIFINGIPTLVMALPLGVASDRYGRKPIIILGFVSFIFRNAVNQFICWFWQAFPIRLVWLSGLHTLMSGGDVVIGAVCMTVAADVSDDASRTLTFLCIAASNMSCLFVGPALAAFLMTVSPWIALFGSNILFLITLLLYAAVPETLGYSHHSLRKSGLHLPVDDDIDADMVNVVPAPPDTTLTASLASPSLAERAKILVTTFRKSSSFLASDWRILALLLAFITAMVCNTSTELLLQYASTRYSITFASATFWISIFMGLRAVTLLLILPAIAHYLVRKYAMSSIRKDLYLARASYVLATLGWILVGFAPSLALFNGSLAVITLSYGGLVLVRSIITGLIHKRNVGKLYTFIAFVDTVALMTGGPVQASFWSIGLGISKGGTSFLGLPFWVQGGLYAIVTAVTFLVNLRKGEGEPRIQDGDAARSPTRDEP